MRLALTSSNCMLRKLCIRVGKSCQFFSTLNSYSWVMPARSARQDLGRAACADRGNNRRRPCCCRCLLVATVSCTWGGALTLH